MPKARNKPFLLHQLRPDFFGLSAHGFEIVDFLQREYIFEGFIERVLIDGGLADEKHAKKYGGVNQAEAEQTIAYFIEQRAENGQR